MEDLKFSTGETPGMSLHFFDPVEYTCPVHGKNTEVITIYTVKHQTVYCARCFNNFLKNNIPVLEDKEVLE